METDAPSKRTNGEQQFGSLKISEPIHDDVRDAPVAPPRRSRPSFNRADHPKDGFQEIFSRSQSSDSSFSLSRDIQADVGEDTVDVKRYGLSSTSQNPDPPAEPPRKEIRVKRSVSKVGNKKSDKFFGENLSDCLSDEPLPMKETPPEPSPRSKREALRDEIDRFIEENVTKTPVIEIETKIHIDEKLVKNANTNPFEEDEANEPKKEVIKAKEILTKSDDAIKSDKGQTKESELTPIESQIIKSSSTTVASSASPIQTSAPSDESVDEHMKIKTNSLERKHKFLESMLTNDTDDAERYKGMVPVDEPIIIPRRKETKHICDGDEHIHMHMHDHHHHNHNNSHSLVKKDSQSNESEVVKSVTIPSSEVPQKPSRDFAKYREAQDIKSLEKELINAINLAAVIVDKNAMHESPPPKPVKRQTSRKARSPPPDPPVRPKRHNSVKEKRQPPTPPSSPVAQTRDDVNHLNVRTAQQLHRITTMPTNLKDVIKAQQVEPKKDTDSKEQRMRKSNSSNSFLTEELMTQMVRRVYAFQMAWPVDDLVTLQNCDDGSTEVAPQSRLASRKTSTVKDPQISSSPTPSVIADAIEKKIKPDFAIGSPEQGNSQFNTLRKSDISDFLQMERAHSQFCKAIKVEADKSNAVQDKLKSPSVSSIRSETSLSGSYSVKSDEPPVPVEVIQKELTTVVNQLELSPQLLAEFKEYLQDEIFSESMKRIADAEVTESVEKKMHDSHKKQIKIVIDEAPQEYSEDTEKKNETDVDDEVFERVKSKEGESEDRPLLHNVLLKTQKHRERSGSIVEMDEWFLKHSDSLGVKDLPGYRDQRRGSDFNIGYNSDVYPFSKRGRYASDPPIEEFFGKKTSKSVEDIKKAVRQESLNFSQKGHRKQSEDDPTVKKQSTDNDHSKLLKIINSESENKKRSESESNNVVNS